MSRGCDCASAQRAFDALLLYMVRSSNTAISFAVCGRTVYLQQVVEMRFSKPSASAP